MVDFEKIVEHFGSQAKMGRRLGVSRQAITIWKTHNSVPPGSAVEIERLTKGKFKAVDLVSKKGA